MREPVAYAGIVVGVVGVATLVAAVVGGLAPIVAYLGGTLVLLGTGVVAGGLLLAPANEDRRPPRLPDYSLDREDDYGPPREKAPAGTLEVGQPRAPKIPFPGRER